MNPETQAKKLFNDCRIFLINSVNPMHITEPFNYNKNAKKMAIFSLKFSRSVTINLEGYNDYLNKIEEEINKL